MGEGPNIDTKRCSRCGEEKPRSDFGRSSRSRDGNRYCCKVCEAEIKARGYAADPERKRNTQRRWRAANREKARAHNYLNKAVARGKITKPTACTRCGRTGERIDAHHSDYSKPLEVEWLCWRCHRIEHGFMEEVS